MSKVRSKSQNEYVKDKKIMPNRTLSYFKKFTLELASTIIVRANN
jgi:hypothetical protein